MKWLSVVGKRSLSSSEAGFTGFWDFQDGKQGRLEGRTLRCLNCDFYDSRIYRI